MVFESPAHSSKRGYWYTGTKLLNKADAENLLSHPVYVFMYDDVETGKRVEVCPEYVEYADTDDNDWFEVVIDDAAHVGASRNDADPCPKRSGRGGHR